MTLRLLALFLACLALAGCAWRFLARPRAERRRGRFLQALGALACSALAGALAQLVAAACGWIWKGTTFGVLELASMLPFSWLVLCGGRSVQSMFDWSVIAVTGHRQTLLMDNLPYYAALTGAQMVLLAALIAWRWKSARRHDPLAWLVCLAFAANAAAGMAWPWWGT